PGSSSSSCRSTSTWRRGRTSGSTRARSPPSSAGGGSCRRTSSSWMTERARAGTVVLGAGNLSMGDDGLGLAVLQRLREGWELPADVELAEGGIWGMTLLPVVEDAGRLIVVDAITVGGRPGEPVELA